MEDADNKIIPVGCVLTVIHLILKSILVFEPDTIEKA